MITSALVAFSTTVPAAFAGDVVWDGSAGAAWATPANWDTNAKPLAGDDVKINDPAAANQPRVTSGTTETVNSVALSVGTLTVRGTLNAPVTLTGGTLSVEKVGAVLGEVTGLVTNPAYIPYETLIASQYCQDADSCKNFADTYSCEGHFSWTVTFKRQR